MPQQQQQKLKGNPASHRMGNLNLKARRAKSHALGEQRAQNRKREQDNQHKTNVARAAQYKDQGWRKSTMNAREERRFTKFGPSKSQPLDVQLLGHRFDEEPSGVAAWENELKNQPKD